MALLTTAGFRHVLDIGRQDIPRRANLYAWRKPRRSVPASVVQRLAPGPMPAPIEMRMVHFAAGSQMTPVLARDTLGVGLTFDGPAIITQLDATALVPPGWRVEVDTAGSILLRR